MRGGCLGHRQKLERDAVDIDALRLAEVRVVTAAQTTPHHLLAQQLKGELTALGQLLECVGQRLAVEGTMAQITLAALDASDICALGLATRASQVLRSDEAELMLRIARGKIVREQDRWSAIGRTLGKLEMLGLVVFPDVDAHAGRAPQLSDGARFSLLLD